MVALSVKPPSAPVRACPTCCGAPALAVQRVTVELAIGWPPPRTLPSSASAVTAPATQANMLLARTAVTKLVLCLAIIDHLPDLRSLPNAQKVPFVLGDAIGPWATTRL